MTLLGTGKLKHGFYDKISERLSNDSPWKPFIENLTKSEALSEALHKALQETYKIHWRAYDYISPHCLLYLVERLQILAPQPKGFFFTTKSSFLEYLISLPPDANPRNSLVTDIKSYPRGMVDFVLQVVEYYLCNRIEMVEWIKRSSINCNSYIPVMLLRLLMILCVVSINWDLSFDILNQKMSQTDITSHLPRVFCEALRPRRRGYIAFVSAVATAFKGVGDPLVIVVLGGNRNFPYPDAAFLDLRTLSRKADIMETLFPRSTEEASHDQPATFETRNVPEPSSIAQSEKGINGKLQINWDLIGEMSKGYESLIDKHNENLKSLLLSKKVEMEEHNNLIISAIKQCSHSDEDARGLIQMLSQLSALITKSEYDTKAMRDFIEIFKILKATRPQLEALLRRVGQNTPNAVVASEEKNEDEDRKAEDSEAAASNPSPSNKGASCSRGKGKDKKRSSSNKGKGSKKK